MIDDKEKRADELFGEIPDDEDEAGEKVPAEAQAAAGGDDAETVEPESLFLDLPDEAEAPAETAEPEAEDETDADGPGPQAADLSEVDLLDTIEIEVSPEEEAEIERRSRLQWFTIHANTGHENKVKRNIEMAVKSNHMEDYFGDILVPIQEVTEMKNGKRVTTKRKFLPGYILVEMLMTKETHHFINSVPGVTGFIGGTPQKPQPVPKDEVDRILGRIKEPDETKETLEIPYKVGDSVQVMDGPFSDWVGVINEINHEKGKLKVMISIFGKETPVELDFLQVKQV
jgi:transcriptional antiterminator NusG